MNRNGRQGQADHHHYMKENPRERQGRQRGWVSLGPVWDSKTQDEAPESLDMSRNETPHQTTPWHHRAPLSPTWQTVHKITQPESPETRTVRQREGVGRNTQGRERGRRKKRGSERENDGRKQGRIERWDIQRREEGESCGGVSPGESIYLLLDFEKEMGSLGKRPDDIRRRLRQVDIRSGVCGCLSDVSARHFAK